MGFLKQTFIKFSLILRFHFVNVKQHKKLCSKGIAPI